MPKADEPKDEMSTESPEDLTEYWDDFKEGLKIPKLTDAKLREFVDDFVSNRIFTLQHIPVHSQDLVGMIFMPVAFGLFSKYSSDSVKTIGTIYEHMSTAGPRSINGYPIFMSCKMLHVKDWERARKAILVEEERRKSIELPPAEEG